MKLLTNAADFVDQWAPKLGEEAARLRWRGTRLLGRSYLLNFVWIPCVIAGAKIPFLPLMIAGILTAVTAGLLIVAGSVKMHQANRVAGQLLGLKIGAGHIMAPPREDRNYQKWCVRYGVTPYAAQERPSAAQRSNA